MKYALIAVAAFVMFGLLGVIQYVGLSNQEVQLASQFKAQQTKNTAVFDNTWKIISEVAEVSDQYKDAFKEIYPALMQGRYGNQKDGSLMKWVTESNPNFDTSLYSKLVNAIEEQRTLFTAEQEKLIDIKREHDVLVQTFPGSIFLSGRQLPDMVIVTSTKTAEAFKSGKDDDTQLFHKTSSK
jgi:hypothetical protein